MAAPDEHQKPAAPNENRKLRHRLVRLLKVRVWIAERFRPTELQVTLFWAGLVGFFGAAASILFRKATAWVHLALTFHPDPSGIVESFQHMPAWERLVVPVIGGLLAGGTLYFGIRIKLKSSTDYMEAIVLGDGVISTRLSLIKSISALFTIASGGSIGREGPLVQLSAMLASLVGRMRKWPTPRKRLIVACGAAAGIASAYNAPIAGALFVAEIIIGSMAMETFGPLVFSSVIATLTVREFLGQSPLYGVPAFHLHSNWEIVPYLILGLFTGLLAPWFLHLLRFSEKLFTKSKIPQPFRLAVGGLAVGILAIFSPEVCGNGYSTISHILHGDFIWQALLMILVFKVIATSATFGSGAVGGVFTPTLFVGASIGYLFGYIIHTTLHLTVLSPSAFALVGMGAFLAATTHAPIMAIIMLYELTRDYDIILPLMLGCVIAYYTSVSIEKNSIYSESLERKGARDFEQMLAELHVFDLMKPDPPSVFLKSRFSEIAASFLTHRYNFLYVVDDDSRFKGVVSLHDIKNYLNEPEIADVIIAGDILREEFPCISPDVSLAEALEEFAHLKGERLPVVNNEEDRLLIGQIAKTDLILALAARKKESEPFLSAD